MYFRLNFTRTVRIYLLLLFEKMAKKIKFIILNQEVLFLASDYIYHLSSMSTELNQEYIAIR